MSDLPAWSPPDPAAWQAVRDRLPPPSGDRWPGVTEYLLDLGVLLQRRLFGWIGDVLPSWAASGELWLTAVYALAGLVLGLLSWALYRFLTVRSGRRDSREIEPEIRAGHEPEPLATPGVWSRRFRRRLEESSWTEALEALWWWAATRLDPRGLSPAWTTDQLVARAGRAELEPPMRELDRLRYGSGTRDREAVLRLHRRLREILG